MPKYFNSGPARELSTVFLDRDGVLNEKMPEGRYVISWSDFHVLPGVPEAIARMNHAGLRVIVVTNQRGIALGLYTAKDVEMIHSTFQQLLHSKGAYVDGFHFCPHDNRECNCRKPLPGLFEQAIVQFPQVTAATSVMIGDSYSDIEFGRRLGMLTVFIEGNSERTPCAQTAAELSDLRVSTLPEAVDQLLGEQA